MNAKQKNVPIAVIDDVQFMREVFDTKEAVLAAFLAPRSASCRKLELALKELAALFTGRLKVLKLNVDDHTGLMAWYEIEDIPTLLCFVHGKLSFRIAGTADKRTLVSNLKPVLATLKVANANHP